MSIWKGARQRVEHTTASVVGTVGDSAARAMRRDAVLADASCGPICRSSPSPPRVPSWLACWRAGVAGGGVAGICRGGSGLSSDARLDG